MELAGNRLWRRTTLGLSFLLAVAGGLFGLVVADTISMILGGAADLRHYAWATLSGLAGSLAFVLAGLVYRLGRSDLAGPGLSAGEHLRT